VTVELCKDTGKRCFTEREAKDELSLVIKKSMTGARVRVKHVETGIYECPAAEAAHPDPRRAWHMTSRPWTGQVVTPNDKARRGARNKEASSA